jgi:DNA (cytosine-5)-methyltransferase 1
MLFSRSSKIERLRSGFKPRLLELCSGSGGLSLGFHSAGFDLAAHIENDETAAQTYAANFQAADGSKHLSWAVARDMDGISPEQLCEELGLGDVTAAFDILAAGLPCQAFARIGRSKLRSITGDDEAFKNDSRAKLYQRFLEYVEAIQPVAVVIENVPDILNFGGHNVPEEICETLDRLGYACRYTLLNSAFYGVPQMRERLFLVAVDSSLGYLPSFPKPTHAADLPAGYQAARTVALKHIPSNGSHFFPIPVPDEGLPGAVSAKAALSDLPYISEHIKQPSLMRRRKVSDVIEYRTNANLSSYAKLMRSWTGFAANKATDGHVVRLTPRDFETFGQMTYGTDYPGALRVAEARFQEALDQEKLRPRKGSKRYNELKKAYVPPYDPAKFPNKWWKLEPTSPSRTLTAHMGKDTYSHIHWDGHQKRMISVREAARLQSFPDGFKFSGAMNAAFRQIGNAVPPLLAKCVAEHLKAELDAALTLEDAEAA